MQTTLILGVDVSKGYGDFVLVDAQKQVMEPRFRLDDNHLGHNTLKEQLRSGTTRLRQACPPMAGYGG